MNTQTKEKYETIKGYSHAKEDIKEGDLVCISIDQDGKYVITNCDERIL